MTKQLNNETLLIKFPELFILSSIYMNISVIISDLPSVHNPVFSLWFTNSFIMPIYVKIHINVHKYTYIWFCTYMYINIYINMHKYIHVCIFTNKPIKSWNYHKSKMHSTHLATTHRSLAEPTLNVIWTVTSAYRWAKSSNTKPIL